MSQTLSVQHAMERPDEDSLRWVKHRARAADEDAVRQHPGDYLHLLVPHPPARDIVVIGTTSLVALGEQRGDRGLALEYEVNVTFGRGGGAASTWRLDSDAAVGSEGLDKTLLCYIPRHSTQKQPAGNNISY